MKEILAELTKHPVTTRLLADRADRRRPRHRPRQAQGAARPRRGPARSTSRTTRSTTPGRPRRPTGMPSGSFGPTTAGRMDSYVDLFQSHGGSLVMIAKGNRSAAGHRRVQEARRLLPRLDRRPGRAPREGEHQEGRAARVPRARHGGDLPDRGRGLPGRSSWSTTRATTSTSSSPERGEDAVIEPLRSAFNASWTERAYEAYKERLAESAGSRIGFRVCESPVFLPPGLRDEMVHGALEIWDQLLQPAALERSKAAVPPEFDVPGSDDHPLFAQADFAIVEVGRPARAPAHRAAGLPLALRLPAPPGAAVPRDGARARGAARVPPRRPRRRGLPARGRGRDPRRPPAENVVLLDLDPPGQSTYPDFAATEKLFGIRRRLPDRRDEARARALVRAGREEDAHPARLQPPDRGRARREEGRAALPLHGGARRRVGGPPELVLPLEQARPARAPPPARARGAPAQRLRPRSRTTSTAGS